MPSSDAITKKFIFLYRLFQDMSGRYLQEYVKSLPQEQALAAIERGKNKEIWASAAELLDFLKGEWALASLRFG